MKAIMMGNIAATVAAYIAEQFGNRVDDDILKGVVKDVLPVSGIVIQASSEELSNNEKLGGLLYCDCDVVVSNCEVCTNWHPLGREIQNDIGTADNLKGRTTK